MLKKETLPTLLFSLILSISPVSSLCAAPIVDGKLDSGEYTRVSDIIVEDKDGNTTVEGAVYTHQENGVLYGLVSAPKSYVDNSYGTNRNNNSVGWGSKVHKFKDLVGSDKAVFNLFDEFGQNLIEIEIDYIKRDKKATDPSEEYYSEGEVNEGEDSHLLQYATSLEYNSRTFNVFLDKDGTDTIGKDMASPETLGPNSYEVADAAFSDWIFEVNYEFAIDLDAFEGAEFGYIEIDSLHASPKKFSVESFTVAPSSAVPEPGTYAILGAFLMLVAYSRQRKRALEAAVTS